MLDNWKERKKEVYNNSDMLIGNVNRMFLTDELTELERMKEYAHKRIELIYKYNLSRLSDDDF